MNGTHPGRLRTAPVRVRAGVPAEPEVARVEQLIARAYRPGAPALRSVRAARAAPRRGRAPHAEAALAITPTERSP